MPKKKPAADLTATLLDKIKQKMNAGGSLTGAEIAFLERQQAKESGGEAQGELPLGKPPTNKTDLAKALGTTRPTLDKYWTHKERPKAAANGEHNLAAWKAFLNKHAPKVGKFPVNGNFGQEETDEPAKLSFKERKERAEALEAERRFAILEDKYIVKGTAVEEVRKANEVVKAELLRRFSQVAPNQYANVEGNADACRAINVKHLDEIFEFLHGGEWKSALG